MHVVDSTCIAMNYSTCAKQCGSGCARDGGSRCRGTLRRCSLMRTRKPPPRVQVLDEPAPLQSDPGVLALQLRQLGRALPRTALDVVGCLAHGTDQSERAKAIDAWVASVAGVSAGAASA